MNQHWNRNSALSEGNKSSEELLNDAFADITDNALEQGPEFLLYAFNLDLEDGESLTLIATDRNPLPDPPDDPTRRIDAVWSNTRYVIGMESKRGAALSTKQLVAESRKLASVADGRESILLVVTEHHTRPTILDDADTHPSVRQEWRSWHAIADRIRNPPADLDAKWGPTLKDAQKLFVAMGFRGFNGVKEGPRFLKSVEDLQVTLCTRLDGYEPGTQFPDQVRGTYTDGSYKPATIHWKVFILDDGSDPKAQSTGIFPCLLARNYREEVYVGLNFNAYEVGPVAENLRNRASRIANKVADADMVVLDFPLNWFENPELDSDDRRSNRYGHTEDRDSIETLLSERLADEARRYEARRIFIGYAIHGADDEVRECIERLDTIESVFKSQEAGQWSLKQF